jgi:predicted amidohydrolase YtcJ
LVNQIGLLGLIYEINASGATGLIGPKTRIVNLGSKMVPPGFNELHAHPSSAAFFLAKASHLVPQTVRVI